MENNLLNQVLDFYKENKWKEVLNLNKNSDDLSALKILWVWPSESNLQFIKNVLVRYDIQGVVSLGCGCGLLEWIIEKYTGFPLIGYEVNRDWWESKYSNPAFISLKYVEDEIILELKPTFALLFCYFNNGDAFRDYIKKYRGNMVIIIGPHDGSGRHTDPQPFSVDFGESNWQLVEYQEIKNTKDYITIYIRTETYSTVPNN